jgi:ADP-heptose:LPS heptosyltransferase
LTGRPGPTAAVAPIPDPAAIRDVVVFRALVLGDLLCATPALRALRAGLPSARITLVGLPWARELAGRLDSVDGFIAFPGHPGLPESAADRTAWPNFIADVRGRRFDLAVQLHGSGAVSNRIVADFGAAMSAGLRAADAWYPRRDRIRYPRWPHEGHEIERLLTLTDHLGMPRQGLRIDFPLRDDDRRALHEVWPGWRDRRYVCVHPGAQLRSRRWPPERFAAVADALADSGLAIVLTGTAAEADLVDAVAERMRRPAVRLAGRTDLWQLGVLIEAADRLISNDTGVSHIAAAFGTPSVVVSSGADAERWAPLDAMRHQVLWQPMPCRPCAFVDCPHGHECADAITPEHVIAAVAERAAGDDRPALALENR